jgi:predicted Zn-dependent protease
MSRSRRVFGVTLLVAVLSGPLFTSDAAAQAPGASDSSPSEELRQDVEHIARLFHDKQFETVVREARPLLARHGLTPTSASILLYEAESHLRLGARDEAIHAYERVLPVISSLDSVQQRRFAWVFFRLAMLARENRQLDQAVAKTETGLRIEPQNIRAQILLGELFNERGERTRALAHFKGLAASSLPTNEERAVLAMKIDRSTTGTLGASVRPPDLRGARLHEGVSIGLIPLHDLPKEVVLADVCVALEAAWLIRCEVLAPIAVPDANVFVSERAQYDGDRVLDALTRWYPVATRPRPFLLAVAGRDLFGPKTSYVFSWQSRGGDAGNGVMSVARFAAGLDDVYEKGSVLMRRVTIQAISTSGSMLGISRPTNPECPTAFPIDFREFQQKRARLCGSDEEQRDTLLRTRGGAANVFGEGRIREIDRVYRAYYLE